MPRRKKGNNLERWEIALVKAMLTRGGYNDQDILAYFTRPTRSVNHRVISEIRADKKHKGVKASTNETLDTFLTHWPDVDPQTGLNLRGDELLIKSREAMIAAVHTFNGAGLTFRSELFIVTSVIAWTYLLHAFFKREGIDYRHKTKKGDIAKTKGGGQKSIGSSNNVFLMKNVRCQTEQPRICDFFSNSDMKLNTGQLIGLTTP